MRNNSRLARLEQQAPAVSELVDVDSTEPEYHIFHYFKLGALRFSGRGTVYHFKAPPVRAMAFPCDQEYDNAAIWITAQLRSEPGWRSRVMLPLWPEEIEAALWMFDQGILKWTEHAAKWVPGPPLYGGNNYGPEGWPHYDSMYSAGPVRSALAAMTDQTGVQYHDLEECQQQVQWWHDNGSHMFWSIDN